MRILIPTSLLIATALVGCTVERTPGEGDRIKSDDYGKADTSDVAVFLNFEWDGELVASSSWNPRSRIESHLLYTVGQLNGYDSVGRLDHLEITDIETEPVGGKTHISYRASMPVAWGLKDDIPTTFTFQLPADSSEQQAFMDKYVSTCVDPNAHDVTTGIYWYYFRTNTWNCNLDANDIVELTADVTASPIQTTGKFPEYDRVWEDDALRAVMVFGKAEEGATSQWDAGISAYNELVGDLKRRLSGLPGYTTIPADVSSRPGVDAPDVTFRAELPGGRTVEIVVLLIEGVRVAPPSFDERYNELTRTADLMGYYGHSGLGANIRALARKGEWRTGQYVIAIINGCDTYAYVDSALADAHIAVNSDDPQGTKYLDIVTNAMPAYFHENADGALAFINALLDYDSPKTYQQIFRDIDPSQVILVSGEQDNTFVPGGGGGGGGDWDGMDESGTVAQNEELHYTTSTIDGAVVFELSGSGDADLYVRVGSAPNTQEWDCRPYLWGSNETCRVDLDGTPAVVHVMVRGWDNSSSFRLEGRTVDE